MYQQINLYQPIFRRQRQIFSAQGMLAAAGVIAAVLLSISAFALWQVLGLEAEVVQLQGREKAHAAQLAGLDPGFGADRRREIDEELDALNERLVQQQKLIEILREQTLGSTGGFSDYLAALARQHADGLWLTRMTIQGGLEKMELAGISLRPELIPEYLQRLGQEPALSGQRFDTLTIERADGEARVSFRVSSRAVDEARQQAFARHNR
jgi:hypothetical protein